MGPILTGLPQTMGTYDHLICVIRHFTEGGGGWWQIERTSATPSENHMIDAFGFLERQREKVVILARSARKSRHFDDIGAKKSSF